MILSTRVKQSLAGAAHRLFSSDSPRNMLFLLMTGLYFLNAFMLDDAYITFRVADNALHGHGLTWNPGERVQAYTNPLWLFITIPLAGCTGEYFFTMVFAQFVCVLLTFALAERCLFSAEKTEKEAWLLPSLYMAFMAAKAVFDYSSSGLENPLTHLLALAFLIQAWNLERADEPETRHILRRLIFITAVSAVNRLDTLFCFSIPLVYLQLSHLRNSRFTARRLAGLVLAASPLLAWELFSLLYYGFFLPNTAYAKLLTLDLSLGDKLAHGWIYLSNSLQSDPFSALIFTGTLLVVFTRRESVSKAIMGGAIGYVLFALTGGSVATHMSGRLFSLPIFMSIFVFFREIGERKLLRIVFTIALLTVVLMPNSCLWGNSVLYRPVANGRQVFDMKEGGSSFVKQLVNLSSHPDNVWYEEGREFSHHPAKVHIGGGFGGLPIGFFGFSAGPHKHILDVLGLADPLMARIPPPDPAKCTNGHYPRLIPLGYPETLQRGINVIHNPSLREYYRRLSVVTRGPLLSRERFAAILDLNRFSLHPLLADYLREEIEPRLRENHVFKMESRRLGPFPSD